MSPTLKFLTVIAVLSLVCAPGWAQVAAPVDNGPAAVEEPATPLETDATSAEASPAAESEPVADAKDAIDEVAKEVDQNPQAQQAKAGVLRPIYALAERFSFPAFHWVAFAIMVAGVVSFALQLVLGKLVVLARMSMSISEILSDALGLAVSLVGLVLTTQAATENSSFTTSAFSVLSATAVGALAGFIFYLWGQRQELQAVEGRRAAARDRRPPNPSPRG